MEDKKTISLKQVFAFVFKHRIIFGVILVALISSFITLSLVFNEQPEAVTIVKSSLKSFSDINELSVLEYSYSSYTTVYEKTKDGKNNKDKPKYHVAYDGTVKLGFDFNDSNITEDKDKQIIYIDIPEIKVNSVSIDENSLDFIFAKDKYETEDIVPKSIPICKSDLEKKVNGKEGTNLRLIAEENAFTTIQAMIQPLIECLPDGYTIQYR